MVRPLADDPELTGHGRADLRAVAAAALDAGLAAADPRRAVREAVRLCGDRLEVAGRRYELGRYRRVWLVGAGKASARLAQGVEDRLGRWLAGGLVVVRRGGALPLTHSRLVEADHPLPGTSSVDAAQALLELADQVGPDDLVISCISGGSSALVCLPAEGISLAEKRELHTLLLSCGADITEINLVRKHTSGIKGGRLAQALAPATILNLTVSDVAGDPAEYVCDLTVRNTGTAADAGEVLHRYGLWDKVPAAVRAHLSRPEPEPLPALSGLDIATVMVVTAEQVAAAMLARARTAGLAGVLLGTELAGPAAGVGAVLASLARGCARTGNPFAAPVVLVAAGGESSVALDPARFGAGGPNQELAVAAALGLRQADPVVLAAIDSDGSDGGTAACGGMVDGYSAGRARQAGVDLDGALRDHRTGAALERIGDLVRTGPTHTNVNDLVVAVVGRPR